MNEKQVEKFNELRMYAHLAPQFLPMLEKRKANAQQKLLLAYSAQTSLVGPTAELAVLFDMEREILGKIKQLEKFDLKGE